MRNGYREKENMIFTNLNDDLQNKSLAKKIYECIKFTKENDLKSYEPGKYEIPGTEIKMNIDHYNTKSEEQGGWESHLKYLDVQIMLEGQEYIAFNNIHNLEETERIVENDFLKHKGPELFRVLLKAGDVLVFYPEDVHMPGLQVEKSGSAKKVVFKIDVNLL